MDLAEHLPPDVERLAIERFGAIAEAEVHVDASELDQRDRDILVHVAEQPPPHRQRFFQQRLRAVGIALFP